MASPESLEKVEISSMEAKFEKVEKSDFGQVLFHGIAKFYPESAHVQCAYTVTSYMEPSSWDWVGLFKVGWVKSNEKITYDWAKVPDTYSKGNDFDAQIVFQAHTLPKDDGEFYQFCYITSSGHVRGASTPFQFRRPGAEDFVELEDDDIDMLVISSRASALEKKLEMAEREKEELLKTKSAVDADRASLLAKIVDLEKQTKSDAKNASALKQKLREKQSEIDQHLKEATDMGVVIEELKEREAELLKEKKSIEKQLDDKDITISGLKEKLKEIEKEKDEMAGKIKNLQEEKEMYKNHFSSTEEKVQAYQVEIENLRKHENTQEEEMGRCKLEMAKARSELEKEKKITERFQQTVATDQETIATLSEKLKNTEDRLSAAEECKRMLTGEIEAVKDSHMTLSDNFVRAQSEAHDSKEKLTKLEHCQKEYEEQKRVEIDALNQQIEQLTTEKEELLSKLKTLEELVSELEVQVTSLKAQNASDQEGSAYALQPVLNDLKARYSSARKKYEKVKFDRDEIAKRLTKSETKTDELTRERDDLKERIAMCSEEYKIMYTKMSKEIKSVKKGAKPGHAERVEVQMTEVPESSFVKVDTSDVTGDSEDEEVAKTPEKSVSEAKANETLDLSNSELQAQLDDLGRELEQRSVKKRQYKQRFLDEKEKNSFLQRHYEDEFKKHQDEMSSLQRQIEALKMNSEEREKRLAEVCNKQKDEITRLKGQLAAQSAIFTAAGADPPASNYTPPEFKYPNPYAPDTSYAPDISAVRNPPETQIQAPPSADAVDAAMHQSTIDLEPALTPLPPPMTPEVLPSAKVAAVKAVNEPERAINNEDLSEIDPLAERGESEAAAAAAAGGEQADVEEEKFQDAVGYPQAICPICQKTFSAENVEVEISKHIDAEHTGPECPMCKRRFEPGYNQTEFECHVQTHFDEDNGFDDFHHA